MNYSCFEYYWEMLKKQTNNKVSPTRTINKKNVYLIKSACKSSKVLIV